MQIASVEDGGNIRSVKPMLIESVLPLGGGSLVTLAGGQRFASHDSVPAVRRRLRALPHWVPGRSRALRRLWVADLKRLTRWVNRVRR